MEWIKLKNEIPDRGKFVLCTDGWEIEKSIITEMYEFGVIGETNEVYKDITHWMYLPELP